MGNGSIGDIWGRGEHAKNGFGVGESDRFSLSFEESASLRHGLLRTKRTAAMIETECVGSESCNCFVTTVEVFKTNRIGFSHHECLGQFFQKRGASSSK